MFVLKFLKFSVFSVHLVDELTLYAQSICSSKLASNHGSTTLRSLHGVITPDIFNC